jgi:AmmeMemoRadiSam system protein B
MGRVLPVPPPRRLHVRALTEGGERVCELRDPLGVMRAADGPDALSIPALSWTIARHFDGARDAVAVAAAVERATGEAVDAARVERVAAVLSEHLLLEDERFRSARDAQLAAFRAAPARPAVGPGRDYEPDPLDLRIRVGGLVANDWDMPEVRVRALVTPATDLARGGRLYARSWGAVRRCGGENARVLLLGPASADVGRLLVPCPRAFDTPLGTVPVDTAGIGALEVDPGPDELAHRDALVLERQALFLRLILRDVPVVPVLVGTVPAARAADAHEGDTPAGRPEVEAAVAALGRVLALEGPTLVIAAADLAHAGPRHATPWNEGGAGALGALRALDADCADRATRVDPEGFWRVGQARPDPARARNMVPVYLLLRLVAARNALVPEAERWRGSVLGYEHVARGEDVVTAASIAFH